MRLIAGTAFAIIISIAVPFMLSAAPPGEEPALGPLEGRNVYAPHQPWFSFVAEKAEALPQGTLVAASALYYVNEFSTYPFNENDYAGVIDPEGRLPQNDQDDLTAMDYESTIWELGLDWQALPHWRFGAEWRLHARYGGFLDGFIEGWHDALGVANAGREYFDHNRSDWNVSGSNIDDFSGKGTVVAAGDLDLKALWTFYESKKLALAANGAFKIPTGMKSGGFSSGYPDLGLAMYLDWHPWTRWAFYLDGGIIIPLGPNGRVMGQVMPVIEFRAARGLSLIVQANVQSSPVEGSVSYKHDVFGETEMFSLPQMDIKIGARGRAGRFGWQFYFEEDPITWEGPDFVVFFGVDWTFKTSSQGE